MAVDDGHPTSEASWLRENWNRERLGQYDKRWIAVKSNQVIASNTLLETLLSDTIEQNPLYAFVYLGPIQ